MSKLKEVLCGTGGTSVRPEAEITGLLRSGAFVLDVRTKMEAKKGLVPGAKNIPLLRLMRQLDELSRDRTIITYCGTGERAGKARDMLEAAGYRVLNGGSYETLLKLTGNETSVSVG